MHLGENKLLAVISVNGASASMIPFVQTLQPILSAILTVVQIGVAIITLLILMHKLKGKNSDKE